MSTGMSRIEMVFDEFPVGSPRCESSQQSDILDQSDQHNLATIPSVDHDESLHSNVDYSDPSSFLRQELQQKTILLIDADWLINFYRRTVQEAKEHQVLPHHHQLLKESPDAFLCADAFTSSHDWCSRIVVLSYVTLGADHPDPTRWTLKKVVAGLELFRQEFRGEIGMFWDYCSLGYLSCTPESECKECRRIERGLRYVLPALYMHPKTTVFVVKTQPPMHHKSATEHQRKPYSDRGWPFTEECWASYVKVDCSRIFNISQLDETALYYSDLLRRCGDNNSVIPPYRPDEFKKVLATKSFSSRSRDLPRVHSIVDNAHTELVRTLFGKITELSYDRQAWEDENLQHLIGLLQDGYACELKRLDLSHNLVLNSMGDSFEPVVDRCRFLCELDLSGNPIGSDGVALFTKKLFRIRNLHLRQIGLDPDGCRLFASNLMASQNSGQSNVCELDLSNNMIGDFGLAFLAPALVSIPTVCLRHAGVTDKGCDSLVSCAECSSAGTVWEKLDLRVNEIRFSGALMSLRSFCVHQGLRWSGNPISSRSLWQLSDLDHSAYSPTEKEYEESIANALESGAVALVRAKWLIDRAKCRRPVPRRQDLPEDAIISKADLERNGKFDCHNIVVLSHMWLSEEHPDPLCTTLGLLSMSLSCLMKEFHGDFCVFWDFLSLHQKDINGHREEDEHEKFREGLSVIPSLFLCPFTIIFQVTEHPEVPGHRLVGQSALPYMNRGWCFSEYWWSSINKRYSGSVFNLSNLPEGSASYTSLYRCCAEKSRHIPLHPCDFKKQANTLHFGREDDRQFVKELYASSFEKLFRKLETLNLENLRWKNFDAMALLKLLENGCAQRLISLNMSQNQMTGRFCSALVGAVAELPCLRELDLSGNPIGNGGVVFLRTLFPKLHRIRLRQVGLDNDGCRTLSAKVSEQCFGAFHEVDLSENRLGDTGVESIVHMFRNAENMMLAKVGCGEIACRAFCRSSAGAKWKSLDLQGNCIAISGPLTQLVEGLLKTLRHLNVNGNPIRKRSKQELLARCAEKGVDLQCE